jgi:hypothetical protein
VHSPFGRVNTHSQSRNFALNPNEGLKISAFKGAHTREAMADRELDKLARYMLHIANVDDFRTLSHKVTFHNPYVQFSIVHCSFCIVAGLEDRFAESSAGIV